MEAYVKKTRGSSLLWNLQIFVKEDNAYQCGSIPEGSVTCGHNECGAQTTVTDSFEREVKYL
jgi:hypothetical protein